MMTIAVCVCSYGDESWREIALSRAVPSVEGQEADELIVVHEPSGDIASCRNHAAESASSQAIIYCDADDELDTGYVAAMRAAVTDTAPVLATPRVSYIVKGRAQHPKFWPEKPLSQGNWMVIGTMVQRDQFLATGGFDARPHAFEDWAVFARLWRDGARIVKVPAAVYRAHWMPNSRNKRLTREEQVRLHYDLGRELFPDEYPPSWLDTHLANARRVSRR